MYDVITIGTATRDAFVKSGDFSIRRDRRVLGGKALLMPLGVKLEIPEVVFTTGGGATNAAVTFRRHGLKTAALCAVGNDVAGDAVIQELSRERIGTDFIVQKKGLSTGYSILLHPEGGERTVLIHRGASEGLSSVDIPWKNCKARWFYITSLGGNISLLKKIVAFAKKNNIRIAYNPGGSELKARRALAPLLRHMDILSLDRGEASLVTGVPYAKPEKIFAVWDYMSPGINIMTDARNGVWVSDGKFIYHAGVFREKAVRDRTGAGDAFGSGFTAAIIDRTRGKKGSDISACVTSSDIEYAIRFASANATAKIEGIGAKYGLLTRRAFEQNPRWRKLLITKKHITNG